MKKVLVTGAALLIAGSMVSAASAEVNLSGDARVRYVGTSDYQRMFTPNADGTFNEETNGYADRFDSRIRVKFDAKANGGAFMKARLRFDDFTWDGQGWGAHNDTKNVWTDYAYIGVPMGPVTFTGGRMTADFSKFFSWDGRPTRVKLDYKSGNLRFIGLIDVIDENVNVVDDWNDNDFMGYGLIGSVKVNDDWSVKAYARYVDDQRENDSVAVTVPVVTTQSEAGQTEFSSTPSVTLEELRPGHNDRSGFLGTIHAAGKAGPVGLVGEFSYKEADVQGTEDDGKGAYVYAYMDMGAFTPGFMIGGTWDGFMADDDFGFIMIGAAEPITVVDVGNKFGDLWWAGFTANYAVSDQFKLAGNLAYADYDTEAADRLASAWEISGSATYTISENADLTYKLGALIPSLDGRANAVGITDDTYFGQYLRMAIKF